MSNNAIHASPCSSLLLLLFLMRFAAHFGTGKICMSEQRTVLSRQLMWPTTGSECVHRTIRLAQGSQRNRRFPESALSSAYCDRYERITCNCTWAKMGFIYIYIYVVEKPPSIPWESLQPRSDRHEVGFFNYCHQLVGWYIGLIQLQ